MSNFAFLTEWSEIQEDAQKAESLVYSDPRAGCFYTRRTLERMVEWMYNSDTWIRHARPKYDNSLNALINQPEFKDAIGHKVFSKIRIVQKVGNSAVHSQRKVTEADALQVLKELHHVLFRFYGIYTSQRPVKDQVFDASKLSKTIQVDAELVMSSAKKLKALQKQLEDQEKEHKKQQAVLLKENAELRQKYQVEEKNRHMQVAEYKAYNTDHFNYVSENHDYNEAQTREFYIDKYLLEMGWDIHNDTVPGRKNVEHPLVGMPNKSGTGEADYVLWDGDGKPLAVIEAKRTSVNARDGKQQALLYANCLEQMYEQRPLIYYTNGHDIYLWDDHQYSERLVQGFLSKDELKRIIDRRDSAKKLSETFLNTQIAGQGRPYQRLAIESVCRQFEKENSRRELLVMATGTGKTRTTIALVDVLMRAGWVKNTLFLADRNALVNQAKKEFARHLPKSSPEILSSGTTSLKGRVYLSTYPTMMNLLNEPPETRLFGVGHFDLVIVDEAHRSVYKKYRYIFDYFDSLLLGLTATPKSFLDANTYEIFERPDDDPTYAYELDEAVADKNLVPGQDVRIELGFIRKGIKYNELPKHEQEQWESKEQLVDKEEVLPAEINEFLFNEDTINKALEVLMERGLKVAGGDRLGKTIIFAANNAHAEKIVECFDKNYRKYKGKFARVITYQQKYADSLIEEFKGERKPQDPEIPLTIAVSVDMLDTGVDVPEIVNLMFFKVVKSKVKFLQMLGRGTRLCADLFAPNEDKTHYRIFDCCKNLEYFEINPDGAKEYLAKSLSHTIFLHRLNIIRLVDKIEQPDGFIVEYRRYVIDLLRHRVKGMNLDNFIVRPRRPVVEKYQNPAIWQSLSKEDLAELEIQIAPLPSEAQALNDWEEELELANRFDQMLLSMQLAVLENQGVREHYKDRLLQIAVQLERKSGVDLVTEQMNWIKHVQSTNFWQELDIESLEETRRRLRRLTKYIDKDKRPVVYTNFRDSIEDIHVNDSFYAPPGGNELTLYRKRVESYIEEHQDHITIQRLKRNLAITQQDLEELDRKLFEISQIRDFATYQQQIHPDKSLGVFIRELIGLDRAAAKQAFADFLDDSQFNPQQIHFINTIIDYLTQNGVMNPGILAQPPFSDIHFQGVFGLFDMDTAMSIKDKLKGIAASAVGE